MYINERNLTFFSISDSHYILSPMMKICLCVKVRLMKADGLSKARVQIRAANFSKL